MTLQFPLTSALVLARRPLRNRLLPASSVRRSSTFLSRPRLTVRVFRFYSLRTEFSFSLLGAKCPFRDEVRLQGQLLEAKPCIFRGDAPDGRCKPRRRIQQFMGHVSDYDEVFDHPGRLVPANPSVPCFSRRPLQLFSTSCENSLAFRGFSQERFQDHPL